MTRKDIEKAAEEYANDACRPLWRTGYEQVCMADFIAGAKWRVNSVWHDVNEKPELNEFFVYCDENNQYETDCFHKELILTVNWEDYVAVNKLKRWAYMKDLVPKENI